MKKFPLYLLILFGFLSCTSDDNASGDTDNAVGDLASVDSNLSFDVTYTTASFQGNVTDNGGSSISAKGFCWSTNPSPTLADFFTESGSGTGPFETLITELEPATQYYVRAFASNDAGTAYSQTILIITEAVAEVETAALEHVFRINAYGGGSVSDLDDILEYGLCWSTSSLPTINDQFISTEIFNETFVAPIENLEASTTYYIRAFARNSELTLYGNELSFETKLDETVFNGNLSTNSQEVLETFQENNYSVINGNLTVFNSPENGDPYLSNLTGLSTITTTTGNLSLFGWGYTLAGLENLNNIGGDFKVAWLDYPSNFEGMNSLTTIGGSFLINTPGAYNPANMDGLENLKSIGGDFVVADQGISNLDGLVNLESIGGSLSLIKLNGINIQGLISVQSIGGSLEIVGCNSPNGAFRSLDGLQNIASIGENIRVSNNFGINDYCALENIILSGGYGGTLILNENSPYDITREDFEAGNCSSD